MDYITWCIIAGIAFWLLCALAVVTGIAWVFCYIQYYRWDKQDRERDTFIHAVQAAVQDAVEQSEQKSMSQNEDIEESEEYTDFVM